MGSPYLGKLSFVWAWRLGSQGLGLERGVQSKALSKHIACGNPVYVQSDVQGSGLGMKQ